MDTRSPLSEVTLIFNESGIAKLIDTYRAARPEEFRWVSEGFAGDFDTPSVAIRLHRNGSALDFKVEIETLAIDAAPPDPAHNSPIPPDEKRFQIVVGVVFRFADLFPGHRFEPFRLDVFMLIEPKLKRVSGEPFMRPNLRDLRLVGLGPDGLRATVEHAMTKLLEQAMLGLEIPASFNTEDLLTAIITRITQGDNALRVHVAADLGDHQPEF